MKIVVIGGTGLIGSKLVKKLKGHEVIAASPSTGVNTLSGEGLAKALEGAEIVVDVANSPSFEAKAVLDFFETSTRNLITAEKGVLHHIVLSVVGTDILSESGYFRAKSVQEKLITESSIPYTIVRATQFFEFLDSIAQESTVGQTVHVPPALIQPIAAEDVAEILYRIVSESPRNGIVEIAGPDRFIFPDLMEKYLKAIHDPRRVISDVHGRYYGIELKNDELIPKSKNPRLGSTNLYNWIQKSL